MGQQLEGQILFAIQQKQLDDVAGAHVAGCDVGVMRPDVADDVLQYRFPILLGNDAHIQGDGVAALTAGTHLFGFRVIIGL